MDFSILTYLSTAPIRQLPEKPLEIEAIFSNNFVATFQKQDFDIQFRYRMRSIKMIFYKELIWTFFTMLALVGINIQYIILFKYAPSEKFVTNIKCLQDLPPRKDDYWRKAVQEIKPPGFKYRYCDTVT